LHLALHQSLIYRLDTIVFNNMQAARSWLAAAHTSEAEWLFGQLRQQLDTLAAQAEDTTSSLPARQEAQLAQVVVPDPSNQVLKQFCCFRQCEGFGGVCLQFHILEGSMCLAKQQQQDVLWTNLTVKMQQFLGTSILAPTDLASICLMLAASLTQSPGQASQAPGAAVGQARLLECVHGLLEHSSQALQEQALEQGDGLCAKELLEVQQQINSIQGQVGRMGEKP
jgi:hypothetical protein